MHKKYSKKRYKRKRQQGRGIFGQDKWSRYYKKQKGRGGLFDIFGAVNPLVGLLAKHLSK